MVRIALAITEVLALCACVLEVSLCEAEPAQPIALVRRASPMCAIVVESGTGDTAAYQAAMTLRDYLRRMTGATVPITPMGGWPEGPVIFVGKHRRAIEIAGEDLCSERLGDDGFVMRSDGEQIALVGMTDRGTMSAVYAFLEVLGCRFYMPVPDGFVTPSCSDLSVKALDVVSAPCFGRRRFFLSGYVRGNVDRIPDFHDTRVSYEADCFEVQSEYLAIMRTHRAEGPSAGLLGRLAALTERISKSPHPWAVGASLMQSAFIPSLRKEIEDAMSETKQEGACLLKVRKEIETGLRLMGCAVAVVGGRTVVFATGERHDSKRPCLMALTPEGDVLWRDEFPEETGTIAPWRPNRTCSIWAGEGRLWRNMWRTGRAGHTRFFACWNR